MKSLLLLSLMLVCGAALVAAQVQWEFQTQQQGMARQQCPQHTVAMAIPPAHRQWWANNPLTRDMQFSGVQQEYLCVDKAKLQQVRMIVARLGLAQRKNINIDPSQLQPKPMQQIQMETMSGAPIDQLDERFYLTREFQIMEQEEARQQQQIRQQQVDSLIDEFDSLSEVDQDIDVDSMLVAERDFGTAGIGGYGKFGRFGGLGLGLGYGLGFGLGRLGLGFGGLGFGYPGFGWGGIGRFGGLGYGLSGFGGLGYGGLGYGGLGYGGLGYGGLGYGGLGGFGYPGIGFGGFGRFGGLGRFGRFGLGW